MKRIYLIFFVIVSTHLLAGEDLPLGAAAAEAKNTAASISWTVIGTSFVVVVSSLVVAFLWHQHANHRS